MTLENAFQGQSKTSNKTPCNNFQLLKTVVMESSRKVGYFHPCVNLRQTLITDLFIQNRLVHNVITDQFIIFKRKENNEEVIVNRI